MTTMRNLPNWITAIRLAGVPVLLWLAWLGHATAFLWLLGFLFLTDAVDGYIARKLQAKSPLGAMLDSHADFAVYAALPVAAWWLWPETIKRELFFVALVVISYSVPVVIGFLKFRAFTSYHTWSVKTAAVMMDCSVLLLFAADIGFPFRVAAVVCIIAAIEEIAITLAMAKYRSNVPSIWHVLRNRGQLHANGNITREKA